MGIAPSGPTPLKRRVETVGTNAGVGGCEVPIGVGIMGVASRFPCLDLTLEPSIAQSLALLADNPPGFSVLTGENALYFTMLCNGADDGILASAHLETELFVEVGRRQRSCCRPCDMAAIAGSRAAAVQGDEPHFDQA